MSESGLEGTTTEEHFWQELFFDSLECIGAFVTL